MSNLGSMQRPYRAREEMESVPVIQSTMKGIAMSFPSTQIRIGGNAQVPVVVFYVIIVIGIVLHTSDFMASVMT